MYLYTWKSLKYDSDICSLDITQKHLRWVPITLRSTTRLILKPDINHAKCHVAKFIRLAKLNEGRSFMHK